MLDSIQKVRKMNRKISAIFKSSKKDNTYIVMYDYIENHDDIKQQSFTTKNYGKLIAALRSCGDVIDDCYCKKSKLITHTLY